MKKFSKEVYFSIVGNFRKLSKYQQGNNLLVYQEKPKRKLDINLKKEIDNILAKYQGKEIHVEYLSGDSEVYNFANEINRLFETKGRI
jgi:hypothetical protein